MVEANRKINTWILFSMDSLRRDKRKVKSIDFDIYFSEFCKSWDSVLKNQGVELKVKNLSGERISKKVYEIDLDSIFNNLLINSISAFGNSDSVDRVITIRKNVRGSGAGRTLHINYEDSGPGLDRAIKDPKDIFKPLFTTKVNGHGEQIGTGLGMWIVQRMVADYSGSVEITKTRPGFGLKIIIPL